MCYFIYLASPLTLSEVRSMLPAGLTADLVDPAEQKILRQHHPDAQTVARVVHGACSCDLVMQRQPVTKADEAHLRSRYRELRYPRDTIIRALERHRRALERRLPPPGHLPKAFAAFVIEHARNAGPTLYYCQFAHDGLQPRAPKATSATVKAADVGANLGSWLPEDTPVLVV